MRLDKAERAIEAERATVCELRRRLAAAEQVPPAPLRRSPAPHSGAPGTRAGYRSPFGPEPLPAQPARRARLCRPSGRYGAPRARGLPLERWPP
jgi:hypothetical protein